MSVAQIRRAARNLATSTKTSLCALKKNERRGAKTSTSRPAATRRLDVGDAVGEREAELLRRARAGLADVVAGDRDRVEARQALVAVAEEVDRQAHRRARREDVVAARGVLLEHVVLHRAAQIARRDAVLLAGQLVEQQEHGRRRVDRHRRRDLAQRDAVEEPQHVVERVDRDAGAAHLAARQRIVRVEAELRGQVERDREARLPALEQQVEALVRLLGRRETRVLAHRPRARARSRRRGCRVCTGTRRGAPPRADRSPRTRVAGPASGG